MSRYKSALTALFLTTSSVTAQAGMFDGLSDQDRAALREEIRNYLLEEPAVLFEAVEIYEQQQARAQIDQDEAIIRENYQDIFNDGQSVILGNPDADLVLVEFTDYKCGFCKKALMSVSALLDKDPNVGVIIKELPVLGQESLLAARYAVAGRNIDPTLYGDFHLRMMSFSGPLNEDSITRMAGDVGYDVAALTAELDNPAIMEHLRETRLLSERLGIQGTPGFVTPTQVIRGYMTEEQMTALVAEIRAQ